VLHPGARTASAVDAHGDLIGVWEDVRLQEGEVRLAAGDTLVAYTDGVTGEEFEGLPGLGPLLRAKTPASALDLATAIEQQALRGNTTPRDDIAVVALRFLGGGAQAHPAGDSASPGA
jgi:serine phosphatase RsbU (regulator of sigma subunit)